MGKLAGKSMAWLKDAEEKYLTGIPSVTDPKRRSLMKIGLDAVQEEIRLRSQKKTEVPSAQRQEPVPEKQEQQGTPLQKKESEPEKVEPVLIPTEVLMKVPPPKILIKWANGEVKEMTEIELKRKAIDYFVDILKSNFNASNFYRSMQFNNCVRFLIGLYRFGNDILPHGALHSTFNYCNDETKSKSIELYKQIKENWEKFKDL